MPGWNTAVGLPPCMCGPMRCMEACAGFQLHTCSSLIDRPPACRTFEGIDCLAQLAQQRACYSRGTAQPIAADTPMSTRLPACAWNACEMPLVSRRSSVRLQRRQEDPAVIVYLCKIVALSHGLRVCLCRVLIQVTMQMLDTSGVGRMHSHAT